MSDALSHAPVTPTNDSKYQDDLKTEQLYRPSFLAYQWAKTDLENIEMPNRTLHVPS